MMKPAEYTPLESDRISTREELFEVLELLGGFEEPQSTELSQATDLLPSFDADPTASELLQELAGADEQILTDIAPFESFATRKANRVH